MDGLCANAGARLHLWWNHSGLIFLNRSCVAPGWIMPNWQWSVFIPTGQLAAPCSRREGAAQLFALTIKGTRPYASNGASPDFSADDVFVFGSESSGLPAHVLADIALENRLRLPMMPSNRCLNLSNTVAIVVYEARAPKRVRC